MSVFASYFWLWSIVALLGLLLISTLGAILNMVGFFSPIKRATHLLDDAPTPVQAAAIVLILGLLAYPALIHRLWADATAEQTRRAFDLIPKFPDAHAEPPIEQMGGLHDPTGTDGTYIVSSYATQADFTTVRAFYEGELAARGWALQTATTRDLRGSSSTERLTFRDREDSTQAQYELVVFRLPAGTREVSSELAGARTLFALRLGVIDPRATTQVAWFIDCLVRGAPTFPTCEPLGWNPLERVLGP